MLTNDVLVIGESLIDVLSRPQGSSEAVGGSPANIALGLGRLGARVRLHTALADDAHGQRIAAHLLKSGVFVSAESWSLDQTSKAVVTVDPEGIPAYKFLIDLRMSAPRWDHETVVHVGSISCFLAPGADEVVRFIGGVPANVLLAFDPNIRPQLLPEHSVAVARFEAICERADVVKMSDEDLDWLYPGTQVEAAMTRILRAGPQLVAVTRGGEGALLSTAKDLVRVPVPRVTVRDTVGAGDSFMAALIYGVARDGLPSSARALDDLGAFAARAAAITVTRDGADLPWTRELGAAQG